MQQIAIACLRVSNSICAFNFLLGFLKSLFFPSLPFKWIVLNSTKCLLCPFCFTHMTNYNFLITKGSTIQRWLLTWRVQFSFLVVFFFPLSVVPWMIWPWIEEPKPNTATNLCITNFIFACAETESDLACSILEPLLCMFQEFKNITFFFIIFIFTLRCAN